MRAEALGIGCLPMVLDEACGTDCTLRNNKTIREIMKDSTECHARLRGLLCAGHAQQLGGESLLPNLMEVKG
jgi:hypothetical protein